MPGLIGIKVTGIPEIEEKLRLLGPEGTKQVAEDLSEYFLKVMQESEPPEKHVSRTYAYGKPFFTNKQRAFFFASLRDGTIKSPYHRTGAMQHGWTILNQGTTHPVLENRVPGAVWVYSPKQAMQLLLVGWRQLQKTVDGERRRVQELADIAIRKVIQRLRL